MQLLREAGRSVEKIFFNVTAHSRNSRNSIKSLHRVLQITVYLRVSPALQPTSILYSYFYYCYNW